jgi:hypothetical protein
MSGLLGSIFSFGDDLKKRARGLLHDPLGYANATVGEFNDKAQHAARGLLAGKGGMESVDALGAGPHALGGLLGAIKVFHGSPHVFDKADSSKIGTGEGAQAYGHGLYFAENENVAKMYADNVKDMGSVKNINAELSRLANIMERDGAGEYGKFKSDVGRQAKQQYDALMEQRDGVRTAAGNMYEANLRWPDAAREAKDPLGPQHFLDWDKPIAEQPEAIRGLLDRAAGKAQRIGYSSGRPSTGGEAYSALQGLTPDFAAGGMGRAQASEMLRRKGIPGIAYMDQGSRFTQQAHIDFGKHLDGSPRFSVNGPKGDMHFDSMKEAQDYIESLRTRNYVTFDDALVELLSRNGLPLK